MKGSTAARAAALAAALAVLAGCGTDDPSRLAVGADTESAAPTPGPTASPDAEDTDVALALIEQGAPPYERGSYVVVRRDTDRPLGDPQAQLAAAMHELVRGPSPSEREQGLDSIFSDATAGVVGSVRLTDGHAVVDFHRLEQTIPNLSTSHVAETLMAQTLNTVFQVDAVDSVELRLDGDCDAFAQRVEQGMECRVIDRAMWDADVRPPQR